MDITFKKAKNGDITAIYNNITLHSLYNPYKEAERFVSNLDISYNPPLIIILEPCLCYIVPLLKQKYKNSKIAIIRYLPLFTEYNVNCDYIINYYEHNDNFSTYLYNLFGEELLLTAFFLQWDPSSKAFSNIEQNVIISIKEALEKSKTLLITREYFEKKWLINTINFLNYIKHPIILTQKIDKDVLIISSGPSLKPCLQTLKENNTKFFIICLSSAISVLLNNNIIPDLCISTDGGYWAGQHLKTLRKYNIPIAIPSEGFIQKHLLEKNRIIPLSYNDGLSNLLLKDLNYPSMNAERNGTVSGTALIFALENSTRDIYFCGLDLSNQKGYQHTQPNEIELNNCLKDNRINSMDTRISKSEFSNGVMNLYKDWFNSLDLKGKNVYRVIDDEFKHNYLGQIKDISSSLFKQILINKKETKKEYIFKEFEYKKNNKKLLYTIKNNLNTDNWQKKLYPLSYTSLTHNQHNTDIINRIIKNNQKLLNTIGKILDD